MHVRVRHIETCDEQANPAWHEDPSLSICDASCKCHHVGDLVVRQVEKLGLVSGGDHERVP